MTASATEHSDPSLAQQLVLIGSETSGLHRRLLPVVEVSGQRDGVHLLIRAEPERVQNERVRDVPVLARVPDSSKKPTRPRRKLLAAAVDLNPAGAKCLSVVVCKACAIHQGSVLGYILSPIRNGL